MLVRVTLVALGILTLVSSAAMFAATKTWNRTTGGVWTTAGNWTPNGAPATGDSVIINSTQSANITAVPTISLLALNVTGTCRLVAATSGNTMTVTRTLTVATGVTLSLGTNGGRMNFTLANTATGSVNGTGVLNFDGGTTVRTFMLNGNLTIAPGALMTDLAASAGSAFTLASSGTLQIGSAAGIATTGATGAIQVTGTRTFNTGANYVYNGTSAQATGNGLPATVNNLTINNATGLALGSDVSVSGTLTMTSGNIITGANTLTLGTSPTIRGTLSRTSGTILGNFSRWFTNATVSSVVFPVGTASNYRPSAVSFTAAPSAGGTLLATFVSTYPGENGLPLDDAGTNIINAGDEGYWTMTPGNGLTGGTYTLDVTADGFAGVNNFSTLRILKRNDGASGWTLNGTHATGTGSNSTPTAHRTGMSGFAQVGIGAADSPLPIQLSSFAAVVAGNQVRLNWTTMSELNNYGFEVQKSSNQPDNFTTIPNSFIPGHGTTNVPQSYSFTDNFSGVGAWYYRLKQIDLDGTTFYSDPVMVDILAGVGDQNQPVEFSLKQNYPNPFNPSTMIEYSVAKVEHVRLKVFNVIGQEVATLVDEMRSPGVYSARWDASSVSSGMYFYKLESATNTTMKRMMLLK